MSREKLSSPPSLANQVVDHYLEQLDSTDHQRIDANFQVCIDTGHVMAALVDMDREEDFTGLVGELATQPDYLANSLAHGLIFGQPRILQAMMSGLDTVDPDTLDFPTRIEVMSAITRAAHTAEQNDIPLNKAWQNTTLDVESAFNATFGQAAITEWSVYNLFSIQPFTEFSDPDTYTDHLVGRCLAFINSVDAEKYSYGGEVPSGDVVFDAVLAGLSDKENLERKKTFLQIVAKQPHYRGKIIDHIDSGLRNKDPLILPIFETLRDKIPEGDKVFLDREHAIYLAHQGNIKEALILAEELNDFATQSAVLLEGARYSYDQGAEDAVEDFLNKALSLHPADFAADAYNPPSEQQRANLLRIHGLAAEIGNYDLALETYIESPPSPFSHTTKLMREIINQRDIAPFLESLHLAPHLGSLQKATLLADLMVAFHMRPERVYGNTEDGMFQQILDTEAHRYAEQLEDYAKIHRQKRDRYFHTAAQLLALAGEKEEAFILQGYSSADKIPVIAGKLILRQSSQGDTGQAIDTYLHPKSRINSEAEAGKQALLVMLTNSLLHQDYDSARVVVSELSAEQRTTFLDNVVMMAGNEVPAAPGWILNASVANLKNTDWPRYIGRLANALRIAHLMPRRAQPVD